MYVFLTSSFSRKCEKFFIPTFGRFCMLKNVGFDGCLSTCKRLCFNGNNKPYFFSPKIWSFFTKDSLLFWSDSLGQFTMAIILGQPTFSFSGNHFYYQFWYTFISHHHVTNFMAPASLEILLEIKRWMLIIYFIY